MNISWYYEFLLCMLTNYRLLPNKVICLTIDMALFSQYPVLEIVGFLKIMCVNARTVNARTYVCVCVWSVYP